MTNRTNAVLPRCSLFLLLVDALYVCFYFGLVYISDLPCVKESPHPLKYLSPRENVFFSLLSEAGEGVHLFSTNWCLQEGLLVDTGCSNVAVGCNMSTQL